MFNGVVDLDDPKTYKHLSNKCLNLQNRIWFEIAYSHVWQKYWHPEGKSTQPERVEILVQEFADNYNKKQGDVLWLQEFLFRFVDETENMC